MSLRIHEESFDQKTPDPDRSRRTGITRYENTPDDETDYGKLELADYIDTQAIQELMDDFYVLTRIPMSIIDLKGRMLVGVGWQEICTKFHRVHAETCRRCIESDLELSAGLSGGEFRLYRCKNHMWDAATPIVIGTSKVGNIFSGQFFFDDEPLDYDFFRSQARTFGFDETEYISALENVPRVSRSMLDTAMAFFTKLAGIVSRLSYSNIMLARSSAERETLLDSLRDSEQRMKRAQEIAHLGSWELDPASHRLTWSDEVYRIFGLLPQSFNVSFEAFLEFVHPEDRDEVTKAYTGSPDNEKLASEVVHRIINQSNRGVCWVHQKCFHLKGEDGRVFRSLGMVLDITESRRIQMELADARNSMEWLARFPLENPNPVVRASVDGTVLFINPTAARLNGWSFPVGDRLPELFLTLIRRSLDAKHPIACDAGLGDRFYAIQLAPVLTETYVNIYGIDITDRIAAEDALHALNDQLERRVAEQTFEINQSLEKVRQERKQLFDVLETLPVYVILLSLDHKVPFANRFFRERFGESRGLCCYNYLFKRTTPCENCESFKVTELHAPHHWEWIGPDGRNYDIHDFPFTDTDGTPLILEMGIDITDRKHAETALQEVNETLESRVAERTEKLREKEASLRRINEILNAVTNGTDMIVAAIDTEFRYIFFNDSYREEIYRLAGREIHLGASALDTFSHMPDQQAVVIEQWNTTLKGESRAYRIEFGDPGHRRQVYSVRHTPIRDNQGIVLGAGEVAFNVTDQVKAEKALEDAFKRLQMSEQHFRALAEALPQIVWTAESDGSVDWFNSRWYDYTGTRPLEGLGWAWKDNCCPDDLIDVIEKWQSALKTGTVYENELRIRNRDGHYRWFLVRAWPLQDASNKTLRWFGSNTDVHDLKLAEEKLHREKTEIELANRVMRVFLEASGDQLFDQGLQIVMEALKSQHGVFGYIDEKGDLYCPSMTRLMEECEVPGKCIHYPKTKWKGLWSQALVTQKPVFSNNPSAVPAGHPPIDNNLAAPILFQDQTIGLLNLANKAGGFTDSDCLLLEAIANRIGPVLYAWIQRKMREDDVQRMWRRFELLAHTAGALLQSTDPQTVIESLCTRVMQYLDCHTFFNFLMDDRTDRLELNAWYGITPDEARRLRFLDLGSVVCECVACNGHGIVSEHIPSTSDLRTEVISSFGITAYACHPLFGINGRVIGTLSFGTRTRETFNPDDLSLMKAVADQVAVAIVRMRSEMAVRESEQTAREHAEELARSNMDLEQFAYIASHDLKEPLRMITGFLSLIRDQYLQKLEGDADEYIGYAMKSAERMQELVDALLSFARVGRGSQTEIVDCSTVVNRAIENLTTCIEESGALITHDPMPTLRANPLEMIQVFQNLLGNAIKFRSERAPLIHIGVREDEDHWVFSIRDNGIGIDMRFAERVFLIFQCLHTQDEYPGTGVGLAICKRIVERHGGRIWVESLPGTGSTFSFTIPSGTKEPA